MFRICSACQLGHTVSNGPLWVLTNTVCAYASRVHSVNATALVDNLQQALLVIAHAVCGGLNGGRPIYLAALETALKKLGFLNKSMKELGLEYSVKGGMTLVSSLTP
jgi:hypothetical protein